MAACQRKKPPQHGHACKKQKTASLVVLAGLLPKVCFKNPRKNHSFGTRPVCGGFFFGNRLDVPAGFYDIDTPTCEGRSLAPRCCRPLLPPPWVVASGLVWGNGLREAWGGCVKKKWRCLLRRVWCASSNTAIPLSATNDTTQ